MKSEDFNDIPKNVIYRKKVEESENKIKKNSFLIESLLSSDKNNDEINQQEVINESDSNSCHSTTSCSSNRSISPGCENENILSEKDQCRIPNYPFPHPMASFHPQYQNFELFYHPRNFYFENYELSRKFECKLKNWNS